MVCFPCVAQRKMVAELAVLKEQNDTLATENKALKQEQCGPLAKAKVYLESQDTSAQEMEMLKAKLSVVQASGLVVAE